MKNEKIYIIDSDRSINIVQTCNRFQDKLFTRLNDRFETKSNFLYINLHSGCTRE